MYRHGYFRQRTDVGGWQHEYWVDTDADRVPAALVTAGDLPLTVSVPVGDRQVVAQVWRVEVGRVPLLLLDTNRPENTPADRFITSRLYVGEPDLRLAQYAVLGIGGVRALRAMHVDPAVVHLNEGHAAFACLELARGEALRSGARAARRVRRRARRTVFTTHTPVPAGNDTYPAEQVADLLSGEAAELGVDVWELIARGRTNPADADEPFGVTQFALRSARAANGVAARHGEVARDMWHGAVARPRRRGRADHARHERRPRPDVARRPDARAARPPPRRGLARAAPTTPRRGRRSRDLRRRPLGRPHRAAPRPHRDGPRALGDRAPRPRRGKEYAHSAAERLDENALTLGFARRLATYKRLDLLLADPDRMLALLGAEDRPVQLLVAGKAHPKDDGGKRLVARLFEYRYHPQFAGARDLPRRLRHGARRDARPRLRRVGQRPAPAAGGVRHVGDEERVNGGLQLSVLDGWWPEAYDGANGWAISGDVDDDHGAQDAPPRAGLLPPARRRGGARRSTTAATAPARPRAGCRWCARRSRRCGPQFGATRMVSDYVTRMYPGR